MRHAHAIIAALGMVCAGCGSHPPIAAPVPAPSGLVTVYPHGIDELASPDRDMFARNFLHELGHCWSLRDWKQTPADRDLWTAAIASDPRRCWRRIA